jgi:Uma2 family endonuclease
MSIAKTREPPNTNPSTIRTLHAFREWIHVTAPESGRFWFIQGKFEDDMSPERISIHNFVKAELYATLGTYIRDQNMGRVLPDGALLINESADLGTEPDMMYCSWDSFREGRVRVQAWQQAKDGDVEIHGAPDLVVEIVSDSSVRKDTIELRQAYFDAGILEYWLIDARGDEIDFQLLVRQQEDYSGQLADVEGFVESQVLDRSFQLTRGVDPLGGWAYRLLMKDV